MNKGIWIQLLLPMALPERAAPKRRAVKRKPKATPLWVQPELGLILKSLTAFKPSVLRRAALWIKNTWRSIKSTITSTLAA